MSAIDFRALRWVLVAGFGMTSGVLTGSSASSNGSYYVAIDGERRQPRHDRGAFSDNPEVRERRDRWNDVLHPKK